MEWYVKRGTGVLDPPLAWRQRALTNIIEGVEEVIVIDIENLKKRDFPLSNK